MKKLCLALLMFCCLAILARAEVNEQAAKAIAEKATREALGYPTTDPLRAHRREDLEDDLFRYQIKVIGRIQKAAYFFEVSTDGSFVLSPSESVVVTSSHGRQIQLVAVSLAKGEAYPLYGFQNAAAEFDRLVRDAGVRISDIQDARAFARFYYTSVTDPLADRLMYSPRQLKHEIEDYFFFDYDEGKAKRLFNKWWSSFSASKPQFRFDPPAAATAAGYEAKLATIKGSVKRIPQLDEWTLQISPAGSCRVKNIRTVYPIF